jgi:hypothetical protein
MGTTEEGDEMTRSIESGWMASGLLATLLALGCGAHAGAPEPTPPPGSDGPGAPTDGSRSCAVVLCGPNTYCDDAGGEAKCLPSPSCVNHECPDGQRCELQQVQCIRAPCPEQPTCVPAQT